MDSNCMYPCIKAAFSKFDVLKSKDANFKC